MNKQMVIDYLKENAANLDFGFLSYLTSLAKVADVSPKIARTIIQELASQRTNLKLIASENYCSLSTQAAMGNLLTDKYAEGFAYHRFYAGCDNVDTVESEACRLACELFGAEHAYIQPHSGADANLTAFWAILHHRIIMPDLIQLGIENPSHLDDAAWSKIRQKTGNQRLLALDYYSGGHLTHGYRNNISGMMFDSYSYSVNRETGLLDYADIEKKALEIKPLILLAGYSAYPRLINFKKMREIADKVQAVFMVDMAHFAGLVAGKVFTGDYNPVAHAHVVTTTTHKTLRGPRGGMVLCTNEFAEAVDKGCPLVLGGPLPHIMAAKAVSFQEALTHEFNQYAQKIVENAKALAEALIKEGLSLATGGTDNHLILINVQSFGLTGRQAESALRECGITLNRNALPYDSNGPWYTSGLRIGTPAVTTLGMGKTEMQEIASLIKKVLTATQPEKITSGKNQGQISKSKYTVDENVRREIKESILDLLKKYPLYPELDLEFLQKAIGKE